MKVLFITRMLVDRNFHPNGICSLAGALRDRNHETSVFDPTDEVALEKKMRTYRPDVVAYSSITAWYARDMALNSRLKEHFSFLSVFGGPHATGRPEILGDAATDAVGIGECDFAFSELLDRYANDGDYEKTPGFHVKRENDLFRNPAAPLIENLDSLPFPDNGLFVRDGWLAQVKVGTFLGSRGCVHNCPYCVNSLYRRVYKKPFYRRKSPARLVEEIERAIREIPLQYIILMDDYFPMDSQWLAPFAREYQTRVGLPFWINIRPDVVTDDSIRLLRSAGLHAAALGIEAGDAQMRQKDLKRNVARETIAQAVDTLHHHGVFVQSLNVLGVPGSTLESDIKTVRLSLDLGIDYPTFSLFQAIPGTPLGDRISQLDGYSDSWLHNNIFSPAFRRPPVHPIVPHAKLLPTMQPLAYFASVNQWALHALPLLLRLPLRPVYVFFFKLYDGMIKKTRLYPHRTNWRTAFRMFFSYLRQ